MYFDVANIIQPNLSKIAAIVSKSAISSNDLSQSGKKAPAQIGGAVAAKSPKKDAEKCACNKAQDEACKCSDTLKDVSFNVEIIKAQEDKQLITGIVLSPEEVDGQGDIMSADVIEDAAHSFLAAYNAVTKLGYQHKDWTPGRLALCQSWIAPFDIALGSKTVKAGAWIMTVKVLDSKLWKLIKEKKIKGFSIGGKARVQKLESKPQNGA